MIGMPGSARRARRRARLARSGVPAGKPSPGELAEVFSAVILALSAIAAVYQYWVARADRHVEQTFAFIERFDDDRLALAQRKVDEISGSAGDAIAKQVDGYAQAGLPKEEIEPIADRLFVEAVLRQTAAGQSGDVPTALLEITSFFNGMQICIEQGLCDSATAHAFLDPYASSFWQTFEPVIVHVRSRDRPLFANGMERFIKAAEVEQDG